VDQARGAAEAKAAAGAKAEAGARAGEAEGQAPPETACAPNAGRRKPTDEASPAWSRPVQSAGPP
jgi:hypothetical protein